MSQVEVITACENVCRDFHWLGSFSDWGPTILGAFVALFIATVVYREQKDLDRKLQIRLEQRQAYQELVALLAETREVFKASNFRDESGLVASVENSLEARRKLKVKLKSMLVVVDRDIFPFAQECEEACLDVLQGFSEKLSELADNPTAANDAILRKNMFKTILDEKIREFDDAVHKLINEIREHAYELPGRIEAD